MSDQEKPLFGSRFPLRATLKLKKRILTLLCEVVIEEMERDLLDRPLNELDEIFISAHLRELYDRVYHAVSIPKTYQKAEAEEQLNSQLRLAAKHFPKNADFFRSLVEEESDIPLNVDIGQRLESVKRRLADRFAREFRNELRKHEITSPVEQIFLMEWKLADVERDHHLSLEPQAPIEVGDGTFFLDFLVRSTVDGTEELRIGLELDGHEFHEKTAEQATRDSKRERQIVEAGIPVLRFSGTEVVRNARCCIDEVVRIVDVRRGTV